jgi:protein ImuB
MKRILCIWFPHWPIQRLLAAQPEYQNREIIIYRLTARQGERVLDCNERAAALGIQPSMPLSEARSLPALRQCRPVIQLHAPECDRQALESLASSCEEFSPLVGLDDASEPDSLLLDITGLERFFRGERNLAKQAISTLQARGYHACVAIADTPSAAWAMARFQNHQRRFTVVPAGKHPPLLALPLAGLRLSESTNEILMRLGLTQIGEVARLDRASLKARFGPEIGIRLDRLLGVREEVITPQHQQTCFRESWTWEYPTTNSESLQHVLNHLLQRLTLALEAQQQGCLELTCQLNHELTPSVCLQVALFQPTASAKNLCELVQLQFDRLRLAGPVSELHLTATKVATLSWRQHGLFADTSPTRSTALAGLINRLSSRLGPKQVVRFQTKCVAVPEHAFAYVPAITSSPRRTNQKSRFALGERPLWLNAKPRSLQVRAMNPENLPVEVFYGNKSYQIVEHGQVERIESAWWRGRMVRRDYYRVTTNTGECFWLFQRLQDARWFLHGEFA